MKHILFLLWCCAMLVSCMHKEVSLSPHKEIDSQEVNFSSGKIEILKLQMEFGPDIVLQKDCFLSADKNAIDFCISEKQRILQERQDEWTWEKVRKLPKEQYDSFDCNRIKIPEGRAQCALKNGDPTWKPDQQVISWSVSVDQKNIPSSFSGVSDKK